MTTNWYSWLSKTSLDPSLVYEYGLTFVCNELKMEDLVYFNHEFLQSMGISIAKHRLEILKLARKETGPARPVFLSGLVLAVKKTKKCMAKCIKKLASDGRRISSPYQEEILMLTNGKVDEKKSPKVMVTNKRRINHYGYLDKKVQEKFTSKSTKVVSGPLDPRLMLTFGSPNASGPLDRKSHEKLFFSNRSPIMLSEPLRSPSVSGPLRSPMVSRPLRSPITYDDDELQSVWAALFQDMEPT